MPFKQKNKIKTSNFEKLTNNKCLILNYNQNGITMVYHVYVIFCPCFKFQFMFIDVCLGRELPKYRVVKIKPTAIIIISDLAPIRPTQHPTPTYECKKCFSTLFYCLSQRQTIYIIEAKSIWNNSMQLLRQYTGCNTNHIGCNNENFILKVYNSLYSYLK